LKIYFEGLNPGFTNRLKAEAGNFNFSPVDEISSCDIRVIVDPKKNEKLVYSRDIVILAEPEVVRPDLYKKSFINRPLKILALGRYRADRLGLKNWINFPVELPKYERTESLREKDFALVNEHKFSSSYRSYYGLRRKTILYFESSKKYKLDVYGKEWNTSKYLELRRRINQIRNNKNYFSVDLFETFSNIWETYNSVIGHMHLDCADLQKYKVNICIENDSDYVSEKVWKALYAGTVPLYVGPKLNFDPELKESVIYCNPNIKDIITSIETIDFRIIEEKKNNAKIFLNSAQFKNYSMESAVKFFYSQLNQIL